LANQNIEQLRQYDRHTGRVSTQMLDAILGNVGNVIAFKLGHPDATALAMRFDVSPNSLMNIGRYEAVARILINGLETQAFSLRPEKAPQKKNTSLVKGIIAANRENVLLESEKTLRQVNFRSIVKPASHTEKDKSGQDKESLLYDSWLAKRSQIQQQK
jgi:hypothetical protein